MMRGLDFMAYQSCRNGLTTSLSKQSTKIQSQTSMLDLEIQILIYFFTKKLNCSKQFSYIPLSVYKNAFMEACSILVLYRECVSTGAAGARTRRSLGHRRSKFLTYSLHIFSMDVLVQGLFGTGTFWKIDILAQQHRCRNYFARCQNFHVPKYSGAEISRAKTSIM